MWSNSAIQWHIVTQLITHIPCRTSLKKKNLASTLSTCVFLFLCCCQSNHDTLRQRRSLLLNLTVSGRQITTDYFNKYIGSVICEEPRVCTLQCILGTAEAFNLNCKCRAAHRIRFQHTSCPAKY